VKNLKIIVLCILLLSAVFISACGEDAATETVDAPQNESIEDVAANPGSFLGTTMNLRGFVTNVGVTFFSIENEERTAFIEVNYRGSSALPQEGEEIIVIGTMGAGCCEPDKLMLVSTRFDIVD